LPPRKRSPDPAAAGFFRCFRGLCGRGWALAPAPPGLEAVSRGRYSLDLMTTPLWCSACKALQRNGFLEQLIGVGSEIRLHVVALGSNLGRLHRRIRPNGGRERKVTVWANDYNTAIPRAELS
jgi:hypothetical protein